MTPSSSRTFSREACLEKVGFQSHDKSMAARAPPSAREARALPGTGADVLEIDRALRDRLPAQRAYDERGRASPGFLDVTSLAQHRAVSRRTDAGRSRRAVRAQRFLLR